MIIHLDLNTFWQKEKKLNMNIFFFYNNVLKTRLMQMHQKNIKHKKNMFYYRTIFLILITISLYV